VCSGKGKGKVLISRLTAQRQGRTTRKGNKSGKATGECSSRRARHSLQSCFQLSFGKKRHCLKKKRLGTYQKDNARRRGRPQHLTLGVSHCPEEVRHPLNNSMKGAVSREEKSFFSGIFKWLPGNVKGMGFQTGGGVLPTPRLLKRGHPLIKEKGLPQKPIRVEMGGGGKRLLCGKKGCRFEKGQDHAGREEKKKALVGINLTSRPAARDWQKEVLRLGGERKKRKKLLAQSGR